MQMQRVSLVIPVFNEAEAIVANVKAILSALPKANYEYELVIVDDGSKDQTAQSVGALVKENPEIKFISFTRNFGKEAAIIAGLQRATGQVMIVMDSDLQHPPALISPMLQYWRQGFKVVEAVKKNRGQESIWHKVSAKGFYMLMELLSGVSLEGHSDFKLLDREVVDSYLALPEKQKFFRGLIAWLGYTGVQIPFSVPERSGGGGSRWSQLKLIRYACRNLTVFSSVPLRMVTVLGFLTLGFGFIFGAISLWQKFNGEALTGFTTVNLLIIIIGGSILVSIGILGQYLALLYDEIKSRPPYVLK